MPRPKANPEQHLQAYRLWQTGKGHTEIAVALEHEFANAVSERTISTWIRGFKALTPQTADLDSPFEWHRLGCYGLPWEASDFLLEMWRVIVTGQLIPVPVAPPTTRQMIWFWRVHHSRAGVAADVSYSARNHSPGSGLSTEGTKARITSGTLEHGGPVILHSLFPLA